jgi:hypothetical protein
MPKSTVTTPTPPLTRPRNWPNPQVTLPQKPPNQPSVNKTPPVFPVPRGGGGNS